MHIGYTLSSEEFGPEELVGWARLAEESGFEFATVSDHFHPWTSRQGHSPFVWTVLGAVAQATQRLRVGTAVTCPTMRIHPAIIAQAAATTARLFQGRFFLGLGSGENLNEHVLGDTWPEPATRLDMLEEAIEVIRMLWEGNEVTHEGDYYRVEEARIFTLPESPPEILVAASGPTSARLAARSGDGLVGLAPESELIETFRSEGGEGKPCYGQIHVCYGPDEAEARRTALEVWPNSGLEGNLSAELKTPGLVEDATKLVREEDLSSIVFGRDAERYLEEVRKYEEAGYTHLFLHQIGEAQEEFLRFAEHELLPKLR